MYISFCDVIVFLGYYDYQSLDTPEVARWVRIASSVCENFRRCG